MTNWTEADLLQRQVAQQHPTIPAPVRAKGRIKPPRGMNKTEAAYSAHLEMEKRVGTILSWGFESLTLKLADDTRYTPDFLVITDTLEVQFHETKGFWRDDAKVKIKVASAMFPFFSFLAAYKEPNGGWRYEQF